MNEVPYSWELNLESGLQGFKNQQIFKKGKKINKLEKNEKHTKSHRLKHPFECTLSKIIHSHTGNWAQGMEHLAEGSTMELHPQPQIHTF